MKNKEKIRKIIYSAAAFLLCATALFGFWMSNKNNTPPAAGETTSAEETSSDIAVNTPVTNVPDDREFKTTVEESTTMQSRYFAVPLENGIMKGYSNGEIIKNATTGDWRTHNGVDFKGVVGDPVRAINNGKVIEVYDDALWGTVVAVDHYDGIVAEYRGLGKGSTAEIGQTIKINDKIGNLGEIPIEKKDGAHLHLEIYKDGKAVPPSDYVGKTPKQ